MPAPDADPAPDAQASAQAPPQAGGAGRWLKFLLRWGVAAVGVAWIVSNLTLRDQVLVLGPDDLPRRAAVVEPARLETPPQVDRVTVEYADTGEIGTVGVRRLLNGPDRDGVEYRGEEAELLGMRLTFGRKGEASVESLLIRDPADAGRGLWVSTGAVDADEGGYDLKVPQPLVEVGLRHLVGEADPALLALGLAIFPITFIVTTWRWRRLLRAAGLGVRFRRAFALNVVGQFYSSFLPGNTGGDVVKAIYASRQTSDKTLKARAVVSVLVDRGVGLVSLIILGGAAAAFGYAWFGPGTPTADQCRQVALGAAALLAVVVVGCAAILTPGLRQKLDLGNRLPNLPGIGHARAVVDALELYLRRPGLMAWATVISFPVHLTVAAAGMCGGLAFDLPVHWGYYFVVVPVVVLVGAIPISPQGAGVMEFFAVTLLNRQGVTVAEAFALTMFIRLVHVFWNLGGGVFVLRGGYSNAPDSQPAAAEPEAEPAAVAATA